jgi:PHD/YefM family antitoxin component YafN of YafNO toxin-antitoxin module
VAVTSRGHPVAYVVGVELFDALLARLREHESAEIALSVRLSELQFAHGESVSLEELEAELGLFEDGGNS